MILLLNTSTPTCYLSLVDGDWRQDYEWLAARTLAKGLLGFLKEKLDENGKNWSDISAIGVFEGPGSFTGLRIGITVMNTIADAQAVPIVGGQGDNWQQQVITKLQSGQNDKIVLPFYGSEAKITAAKK
ncbi:MAG: tRNA (adenosine(37)-N6)-threonylcarbamoyltransferase complex dimerization subunit type 1 TsaB [Candidatus Saccharibacteria bacterium]